MKPNFANLDVAEPERPKIELAEDAMSLDILRTVYRNAGLRLSTRMRAAVAALPFEFPKLAVTAILPDGGDFAMRLERAIARSAEVRTIEAKPVETKAIEAKPIEGPIRRRV